MAESNVAENISQSSSFPGAKEILSASEANELFLGVVGHVGSGTGQTAKKLKKIIEDRGYKASIVKASKAIREWAINNEEEKETFFEGRPEIDKTSRLQTLGDEMRKRSKECTYVAQSVVSLIRDQRGEWNGVSVNDGEPVQPQPKEFRAYIIDSIRHPAEVNLLRFVYGDAFAMVGVVCHEDTRELRLLDKYFEHEDKTNETSKVKVKELMERDADDKEYKYGQHVAKAFWESDYFIDNTPNDDAGSEYTLNEDLGRFIDIITHKEIIRPTISETGMHVAVSAQIRSSCLSKQVGAAIVDQEGNVLATGTNEVPKAGGGVYGEEFNTEIDIMDGRCHACVRPHCSNNSEQNQLIEKILELFPESNLEKQDLLERMRKVGLGSLLEFSRAVHAEMDALTSAARKGIPVNGAWMFVTTFPCHYCARHLVAAGIDQVQYIEPYPKSRALSLHGDSITKKTVDWKAPSTKYKSEKVYTSAEDKHREVGNPEFGLNTNHYKVLFKPFVGVAPRLYQRAFTKDRDLKDDIDGNFKIGNPEWGGKWGINIMPYTELEARLTQG